MNKTDVVNKVSEISKVAVSDCEKVLDALETVLEEEISNSKKKRFLFNKIYKIMGVLKSKTTVLLICLLFSLSTLAQHNELTQTIRGTVVDKNSDMLLSFVTIGLSNSTGVGTITDESGKFTLRNIPLGRHTIIASMVGYESLAIPEVLVTSAKEVFLEISLKENIYELGEVMLYQQTNKSNPMNKMALRGAHLLSVEEARRYAGGMDDPARLASSFAGVSPSVGNNGISIHGNAPHLLQWKLEDIEIPNPNHFADISVLGGGILSSLSSNILGNSDFYTGAFPAEFNNAVSGVFDMKMRSGNNQKSEHTFQAGILGIDFATEGPFSKKHSASYIVNYRYSTTTLLGKLGREVEEGSKIDYQDLNFKMNFPTAKAGVFSVWGTALIDDYKQSLIRIKTIGKIKEIEKPQRQNSQWQQEVLRIAIFLGMIHNGKHPSLPTYSRAKARIDRTTFTDDRSPYMTSNSKYTNLIAKTSFNKKFSTRFTNITGVTYTKMLYDMDFHLAPSEAVTLKNISKGNGNTDLISVYNSSLIELSDRVSLSLGVNTQGLTLNNKWTVEPRASLRWQASSKSAYSIAYGLYSRMEKMDVYFVKTKGGAQTENKKLGFTKSHHLMLTYDYKIADDLHLKIEPYAQLLYDVPVIANNSYSVLNRRDFWVEDPLVNDGKGRNFGIDLTFEKYLTRGFYYMITASLFNSKYKGGDNIWHNTRYNRNYISNLLIGKEWIVGRNKQNILSANLKLSIQGGERYSPVDKDATMKNPDKEVQHDETKAYSKQLSPMFLVNYSLSYRMNRKKIAHEFAIQGVNATGYKEYYGHEYNTKTNAIEPDRGATVLTNISYKLNF